MLKKSRYQTGGLCLLVLALMSAVPAGAADDKKGGEQLKRLQQKLRAAEQEKSQLVQGKSELDSQLKEQTDKLNQTKRSAEIVSRQRASLEKELKAVDAEKAALGNKLADAERKLAETEKRLVETTASLGLMGDAKRQREADLAARTQSLSECTAKNESLHRFGVTLLKQYEEKSCLDSGMQGEMLTQLKRVGVENMVDEYREKLDQELVNQQQQDRQMLARQKAEQLKEVKAKEEREKAERLKDEQEKAERLKAKQQNDLDKLTKNIKAFLENLEW